VRENLGNFVWALRRSVISIRKVFGKNTNHTTSFAEVLIFVENNLFQNLNTVPVAFTEIILCFKPPIHPDKVNLTTMV